jgi:DNA invertase Pin-like site-specific DNA recombinase
VVQHVEELTSNLEFYTLLLGLKGTMSEAELHVLRARLQGGILNKARRGELQCPLPVGFLYNANNEPVLDPDKQVQESIRFFFETVRRTASACSVVKAFRQKGLLFPRRSKKGPDKAIWCGRNSRISGRRTFCTILVMRGHSFMAQPDSQQPERKRLLHPVAA